MTMFHVIHDRRGATAFEFTLVLFPLLMFIVAIFDVSRYALTWYSVSNLADEAIRQPDHMLFAADRREGQNCRVSV